MEPKAHMAVEFHNSKTVFSNLSESAVTLYAKRLIDIVEECANADLVGYDYEYDYTIVRPEANCQSSLSQEKAQGKPKDVVGKAGMFKCSPENVQCFATKGSEDTFVLKIGKVAIIGERSEFSALSKKITHYLDSFGKSAE